MAFQRKVENRNVEEREPEKSPVRKKPKHRLGGHLLQLDAPGREGYYRRWMVDRPGRLESAEKAGYSYVIDPKITVGENPDDVKKRDGLDSRTSKTVGTNANGSPQMAYLMEMPLDWYRENQDEKDSLIKEKEKQVASNKEGWSPEDQSKQYIPGKLR
jgi:hypothetical protein